MSSKEITVHLQFGNYTLLSWESKYYPEGREYNVAYLYDPETKSWASGHYCCTLETALKCCLEKMDSIWLRTQTEVKKAREEAESDNNI